MRIQPWSLAIVSLAWFGALVAPGPAGAESPFDPQYPFDTAIIEIEFGGIQSGGATVWIDGDRMSRHEKRTTKVMGMGNTEESWTISTPEEVLIWTVGEPKAYRSVNPAAKMQEEYGKLSASEQEVVRRNAEKMGNVYLGAIGGGEQSTGRFLGYDVDIVEVMGTKQYFLSGTSIAVKQSGGMAGMQLEETATKIEADVDIPEEKFRLPAEVEVVPSPGGDMAVNIAMSQFEALKDPDFERKWKAQQAQAAAAPAGMPPAPPGAAGEGQPDVAEMMKMMEKAMKEMQKAGAAP